MIYNKNLTAFSPELSLVQQIYEYSFPIDERREFSSLLQLLQKEKSFRLEAICNETTVLGMLSWWELQEWRYIEHFAIDERLRGNGVGRSVLREFMSRNDAPAVLEVEPPTDINSKRRIQFYESLGWILHQDYHYIQPSYGVGRQPIELKLMTYHSKANYDLDTITSLLHRHVYGSESK